MNTFLLPEWAVYVLECGDGTLYTGVTNDLPARLALHESGRGAKYTRGRGPFRFRRVEYFGGKGEALKRESAIKKQGRAGKLALCLDASHGVLLAGRETEGSKCMAALGEFRKESTDHRPSVSVGLSWNRDGLSGIFSVENDYSTARFSGFNAPVYRDSCVEFFFQPEEVRGYFNFEWNAAGAMLAGYVTDPARDGPKVAGQLLFDAEDCATVTVLPSIKSGSAAGDQLSSWTLAFSIPFQTLRKYADFQDIAPGRAWKGNFYKCGDETPKPHWASWRPLVARNFHLPDSFGFIVFG